MRIAFAVPAPLSAISGGYEYDRRILAGLRDLGHEIRVEEMAGRHPLPDAAAEAAARGVLDRLGPEEALVVDGLGLPALAPLLDEGWTGRCLGLIHHPTALERGFPDAEREALRGIERAIFPRLARLVTTSRLTASRLGPEFGAAPERIGTVEPGTEVNCSAMYVFCERNCWMRRARATTVLSSSDSSSTPRIAMMSWSSLLRCRIPLTRVAVS